MKESELSRLIRMAASEHGHRLFRNNVGMIRDEDGRNHRFGLCVGSSDLIGWTREGRFAAIEVKSARGRPTEDQERFVAAVNAAGGRAGVVKSVDEALAVLNRPSSPA